MSAIYGVHLHAAKSRGGDGVGGGREGKGGTEEGTEPRYPARYSEERRTGESSPRVGDASALAPKCTLSGGPAALGGPTRVTSRLCPPRERVSAECDRQSSGPFILDASRAQL